MGTPYSAFREDGRATAYQENKTAVSADVTFAGFVYAFFIVSISLVVILPGIRGKNGIFAAIRFFIAAFIGATILLSLYGQDWESAVQHNVTTQYRAFIKDEIEADIGVHIGLTNVNITLKGVPEYPQHGEVKGERINYNERFTFCCRQGRQGYSQFAGRINQEFRAAQWSGKPYPVLWIVEYFVFDAEDIRWGRTYRLAGFYTYLTLWTAFPLWVIAIVTSFMVVRYSGLFLLLTGGCLLTGNIIYSLIRYGSTELIIPFGAEHVLVFSKGGSFYLCMVGGIVSSLAGLAIIFLDDMFPFKMATFFNVDPLQDYQDTFENPKHLSNFPDSWRLDDDDETPKNGSPRKEKQRPMSVLNDDPRVDKLASEALDKRSSEMYQGDMYINVGEMHQSFVSGRKSLFKKNKLKRRPASNEMDDVDNAEDWAGNTSSKQLLHKPSQVRFSVKGFGGKPRTDDSVAMDTMTNTSSLPVKMSQLHEEPDDEGSDANNVTEEAPENPATEAILDAQYAFSNQINIEDE
ncbi:dual oxidase maturation factor 1-like [Asterias amurensis]|uniref:dual oxidase maturation factor 1-like n=1 Tax=Asterias amurensis TaxID=7602 RepID=UPI003AB1FAD9